MNEWVVLIIAIMLFLYQRGEILNLRTKIEIADRDTRYALTQWSETLKVSINTLSTHKHAIEAFRARIALVEKKVSGEDWK